MRKSFLFILCVLAGSLCCAGCASITVNAAKPVIQNAIQTFESEPDPQLAKEAVASQIKLLDALIQTAPQDKTLKTESAKAFFAYAFLFVEDTSAERAKKLYLRGLAQALAALDMSQKTLNGPAEILQKKLARISQKNIAPLFWAGANWSGWINLSLDDPEALSQIANLKILLAKIIELNSSYYYAMPYVLAATIEASQPRMLGGDHKKALKYFNAARTANGNKLLAVNYFQAKTLAVASQQKAQFTQLLADIEKTPANVLPAQRLMNTIIKQKAKTLSQQTEDLFFE